MNAATNEPFEQDDYDSPWKEAIEHHFPEFMAFFFADIAELIDWSKGFSFLDQELRSVVRDAATGKRYVDKLVGLHFRNGIEQWIYIHIEVQVSHDHALARRVFTYNYRIAKRHLVKILYGKGFDRQKILDLFAMIDWMMWLPQNLSQKLWHDIQTIEEQESMRYVTSIERLEREKVYQQGMTQGLNKGESRLLTRLLEKRFGPLPVTVAEKLEAASVQELDTWGDAVLTATRLEDVFG